MEESLSEQDREGRDEKHYRCLQYARVFLWASVIEVSLNGRDSKQADSLFRLIGRLFAICFTNTAAPSPPKNMAPRVLLKLGNASLGEAMESSRDQRTSP